MLMVMLRVKSTNQSGLASIMVVGILVIILSLTTVGFAKLMNRELTQSLNTQLATSANLAAESGINDALTLIQSNPAVTSNTCSEGTTLLGGDTATQLSNQTEYSCMLIDPAPADLKYSIDESKSQVAKLDPASGNLGTLLLSWRAEPTALPYNATSGTNPTDASYGANTPVLRITLYPIDPAGAITATTNANTKTYFLYPASSGGGNVTQIVYSGVADGSSIQVSCNNTGAIPSGLTAVANNCNTLITNLPAGDVFYIRIMPIYGSSAVTLQGLDTTSSVVEFVGAQSLVDVTAKSLDSAKRLQARANIQDVNNISSSADVMPEYALRSSATLCKRLIVPNDGSQIYTDVSITGAGCNEILIAPPTVTLTAVPGAIIAGQQTTLTWTVGNFATGCTARSTPVGTWSGLKAFANGANSEVLTLNIAGTYTFTINCSNDGGGTDSNTVTVVVSPPCPNPVPITLGANSITQTTANITGSVNPSGCPTTYYFDYGLTVLYSNQTPLSPGNVSGNDNTTRSHTAGLSGLTANTTYHYRICAISTVRVAPFCDVDRVFATAPNAPSDPPPTGGGSRPDARIRSGGCARSSSSSTTGTCDFYADHFYIGCWAEQDVGSATWGSIGWFGANPIDNSDNNIHVVFGISGIPTATVNYELRCNNAWSTSNIVTGQLPYSASLPPAACANSRDDDGDGLVDMSDPGCSGSTDNDETNAAAPPTRVLIGYACGEDIGLITGMYYRVYNLPPLYESTGRMIC